MRNRSAGLSFGENLDIDWLYRSQKAIVLNFGLDPEDLFDKNKNPRGERKIKNREGMERGRKSGSIVRGSNGLTPLMHVTISSDASPFFAMRSSWFWNILTTSLKLS